MKYKVELIEWLDNSIAGEGVWHSWDAIEELSPTGMYSVGWVIKETDREIILVPHHHEDEIHGEMLILKSCIVRRLVLLDDDHETHRIPDCSPPSPDPQ